MINLLLCFINVLSMLKDSVFPSFYLISIRLWSISVISWENIVLHNFWISFSMADLLFGNLYNLFEAKNTLTNLELKHLPVTACHNCLVLKCKSWTTKLHPGLRIQNVPFKYWGSQNVFLLHIIILSVLKSK